MRLQKFSPSIPGPCSEVHTYIQFQSIVVFLWRHLPEVWGDDVSEETGIQNEFLEEVI